MNRTLILIALVFTAACKKKPPEAAPEEAAATTPAPASAEPHDHTEVIATLVDQFARVHFELDSAQLSQGSMDALAANAAILQKHPLLHIEVQGHADERGTSDYNLALGDKRGRAVVAYLSEMGVSSSRLQVVSYGEEHPAEDGHDEVAWSRNRRCEFRIVDHQDGVVGTVDD